MNTYILSLATCGIQAENEEDAEKQISELTMDDVSIDIVEVVDENGELIDE